jgi:hypothetical protein
MMPYIQADKRLDPSVLTAPQTPGELNYAVTRLAERFRAAWGDSYDTFNTIVGVLESAKLEFYRRIVSDYEDLKCETNGDVYRGVKPKRPSVDFQGGPDAT